ncbi:OmpW family protein [Azonexus sp.]|uniref:OmpW/AlkL family protein n=1 Tax=Azonexus sp. TaxID=1872668 RepID=UPI0035B31E68
MFKPVLSSALLAAALAASLPVQAADQGSFMVRARAVHINFDNGQSDTVKALDVTAQNRWIPEVDLSYFFTPNIAAELVLTYPQKVKIDSVLGKIGTIKALPPSLMLQYHFTNLGAFKPYVGLGLNYTVFYKRGNFDIPGVSVDRSSVGLAAQAGFDYALDKNWSLNMDVKYIQMDTDVKLGSTKLGKLDLNPITAGIGIGYRF